MDTCKRWVGRARRTMVLSETRRIGRPDAYSGSAGGPTVRLGECLGLTGGRANDSLETAPRTLVPDPGADGEGNAPHHRLVGSGR